MSPKSKTNSKSKAAPKIDLTQQIREALLKTDPRDLPIIKEYVAALASKKGKKKATKKNEFIAEPAFPVKFMEDVAFVAFNTLWEHLKKIGVPEEVVSLFDAIQGINQNLIWIEKHNGKTSHMSNEFIQEEVATCVRCTYLIGGKVEIITP